MTSIIDSERPSLVGYQIDLQPLNENLARAGNYVKGGSMAADIKTGLNNVRALLESEAGKRTNPDRPAMTIITKDPIDMGNGEKEIFEFTFQIQPKERISVSGSQNIAVFKSPGLRPEYQNLGPGESMIAWEGLMLGPAAWDDVLNLKKIQESGISIIVMFGPMMKIGIIKGFTYNINRFSMIQYAISILIEEDKDSQTFYVKFNPLLTIDKSITEKFPLLDRYIAITGWCNKVSGTIVNAASLAAKRVEQVNNIIDMQVYNYGGLTVAPVAQLYELKREIESTIASITGARTGLYSGYMNTSLSNIMGGKSAIPPGRHE